MPSEEYEKAIAHAVLSIIIHAFASISLLLYLFVVLMAFETLPVLLGLFGGVLVSVVVAWAYRTPLISNS